MPDPLVTIVVPMRNEATGITACLESILANQGVDGGFEVLVLDGDSTDDSVAVVSALALRDSRLRLMPNPDRLQAAAFNRGLAAARGKYLVRMDAHTRYAPDYIAECVRLLEQTGAGNVGGVQHAIGTNLMSGAIAAAVSSRFAAGDARYRNATEPGWVDTVYLGAWPTATLQSLGGMRPNMAVNEDYEMNIRLRKAGSRVYLSPSIKSTYSVRGSLGKLARQYFRYGFWKVHTLLLHPGSLRWRQLVAPAFVLSLLATPLLTTWLGPLGATHLAAYLVANLTASVVVARQTGWQHLVLLPLVFFTIHLCWGTGFLLGWGYWPFKQHAAS